MEETLDTKNKLNALDLAGNEAPNIAENAGLDQGDCHPRSDPVMREAGMDVSTRADDTLVSLFAARVAAQPDNIALSFGTASLSYRELEHRSEQLADELRAASIGPGSIVGLCLPRSIDLMVALLAILKSGAAYLPLDPVYPVDRLSYMVEDSNVAMVIGLRETLTWLPADRGRVNLDDHAAGVHRTESGNPKSAPAAADLAYVIYTSGSTGNPKGVGIEHSSVVRLFTSTDHWFAFQSTDVWTLFHSVSFDFTVWEIWGALLYGGRLVIVPDTVTRDPGAFLDLLRDERVTVLNQTPSAFSAFEQADSDRRGQDQLSLRLVVFGGEALDPRRLARWFERRGERASLINMYGITETTVHVTYRPLTPEDASLNASLNGSPIGIPIPDLEILLLDSETMSPVPAGKIGEIFVGGPGLARGYLNRPDLTAARFVPHPWRKGERLYRTGDLARFAPNGEYFHLGRTDHQVKIRGFRVELGEIEAALRSHEDVQEAAVMMRSDDTGQARLVGYVVQNPFAPQRPELLRAHVAAILPEHMVPAQFVFISSLPLTVNGKLDRDALPLPDRARPISAESYRLPGNALERRIAEVIAEVLRTVVGVEDNFFDLGGNSLLIVEIHRRLSVEAKLSLKLMDLYRYPNVRALAGHLNSSHTPATLLGARERGARSRVQVARTTGKPRSDGCPT